MTIKATHSTGAQRLADAAATKPHHGSDVQRRPAAAHAQGLTANHAKYSAFELTRQLPSADPDRLSVSLVRRIGRP
jgi:hypothetical protein